MSTNNSQTEKPEKTGYEAWIDKVTEGGKEREEEIKSRGK